MSNCIDGNWRCCWAVIVATTGFALGSLLQAQAPAAPPSPPAQQQAEALLRARPEMDAISFRDASRGVAYARVLKVTPAAVTAQKGAMLRDFPMEELADLRFHVTPVEKRLLKHDAASDIALLRAVWESRSGALSLPESNAGDWALALGRALRKGGGDAAWQEARALAALVDEKSVDAARRDAGRHLRELLDYEAVVRTGKAEEIETIARKSLEGGDDGNTELLLLAVPFLAQREFEALKAVEKENPRWMEDDEVKPVRDRHYNLSLDMFLHPYLFHGTHVPEASEGLWGAAQVHLHAGDVEKAQLCLKDLTFNYPKAPRAAEAVALLKQTAQPAVPATEKKAEAVTKKDDPAGPEKPAGPPKKYNLFDE